MRREKPKTAVFYLLTELLREDRLPPVTLAVVALNSIIYLELFDVQFPSLDSVCISAISIIKHKEWLRLFLSPFFHGDDWHLYYNMTSFGLKGRSLEKRYGSAYFAILIVVFSVSCSIVLVILEFGSYTLLGRTQDFTACAVGFSAVIFALKVLTTHHLPNGTVYMFNQIPIPSKYAYWAELVSISILVPNVSFAGHLAGIVVGLLYVYGPLEYLMDALVSREYRRQNNYVNETYGYNSYQRFNRNNYRY